MNKLCFVHFGPEAKRLACAMNWLVFTCSFYEINTDLNEIALSGCHCLMCPAMRIQLSEDIYDYLEKCEPKFDMIHRGLRNVLVSDCLWTEGCLQSARTPGDAHRASEIRGQNVVLWVQIFTCVGCGGSTGLLTMYILGPPQEIASGLQPRTLSGLAVLLSWNTFVMFTQHLGPRRLNSHAPPRWPRRLSQVTTASTQWKKVCCCCCRV